MRICDGFCDSCSTFSHELTIVYRKSHCPSCLFEDDPENPSLYSGVGNLKLKAPGREE